MREQDRHTRLPSATSAVTAHISTFLRDRAGAMVSNLLQFAVATTLMKAAISLIP